MCPSKPSCVLSVLCLHTPRDRELTTSQGALFRPGWSCHLPRFLLPSLKVNLRGGGCEGLEPQLLGAEEAALFSWGRFLWVPAAALTASAFRSGLLSTFLVKQSLFFWLSSHQVEGQLEQACCPPPGTLVLVPLQHLM